MTALDMPVSASGWHEPDFVDELISTNYVRAGLYEFGARHY
jgi:hypothetical protein